MKYRSSHYCIHCLPDFDKINLGIIAAEFSLKYLQVKFNIIVFLVHSYLFYTNWKNHIDIPLLVIQLLTSNPRQK